MPGPGSSKPKIAVGVSDLKKNPSTIVDSDPESQPRHGLSGAADTYEAMMDTLDDQALVEIARARAGDKSGPVSLDDL